MSNILQYLFEVTLASSLLFLGFFLIKKYLSIQFRRYYLLACMALPMLFPLLSFNHSREVITQVPAQVSQVFIESYQVSNQEQVSKNVMDTPVESTVYPVGNERSFNWKHGLLMLYGFVSLLLFIRLLISLFTIYRLSRNPRAESEGTSFFLIENHNFTGGSFFHFIFINQRYLNDPAFRIILSHEQTHQRLWHSLDLVLSEIFCVLFWINPIAWVIKKEIRLNAEYEADHYSAIGFGKVHYANVLLNLSIPSQNTGPMLSFSAMHTRKRLKKILEEKKQSWFTSIALTPFLFFAIWLISCEPEMMDFAAMDPEGALKNVKTVTTRYISHQKDTQQKDGKIVAIAYYLPDGTVDRVEQHMTYPYDFEKPFKRSFLASPDPSGVLHILDGFGMGHAEKNILYGNDWPKYAENMFGPSEIFKRSVFSENNSNGLPKTITITDELSEEMFAQREDRRHIGTRIKRYKQNFNYSGRKVTSYSNDNGRNEVQYQYDGDNLTEISSRNFYGPSITRYEYKNDILVGSSFYKYGKRYIHREFFYNSDGLKTRTEMYNVYGEPEYTILYDYEYY